MHDTGFFADIWYADILQLTWLIFDTDIDIFVFFFLYLIAVIIKSPL